MFCVFSIPRRSHSYTIGKLYIVVYKQMEGDEEFSELENLLLNHAGLIALDTKAEGISLQGPVKIQVSANMDRMKHGDY